MERVCACVVLVGGQDACVYRGLFWHRRERGMDGFLSFCWLFVTLMKCKALEWGEHPCT